MFDPIFLIDQSLKSTFAQKQSCRFSLPLQLLFWPNFKFLYQILSFGRSNTGQNQSKCVTVCSCARHGVARHPCRRLWPSAPPPRVGRWRSLHAALRVLICSRRPAVVPPHPLLLPRARVAQSTSKPPPSLAPANSRRRSSFPRAPTFLATSRTHAAPPQPRLGC